MEITPFSAWELRSELQEALSQLGFEKPTPVQQEAFPLVLAGHDLMVQSRTGTGKTLAFGLPLLQRLTPGRGPVAALVMLPTRELAMQVAAALARVAKPLRIEVAVLYGGGSYRDQTRALEMGAQVVVATPGRLCDHLERGRLDLSNCQTLVLDEADEILDMGFAEELDKVLAKLPAERQSLLFSATMAPEVAALAAKTLRNPQTLKLSSGLTAAPEIHHVAYEIFPDTKVDALVNVLHAERPELAIVFCHTKAETESLSERLDNEGLRAGFLNGDLPQIQRTRTLNAFRRRQLNVLVATDVAARGIDVKGITHVFNLGVPRDPEIYIHRVGRTGRAGASGQAVTFVPPRDANRFRLMLQRSGLTVEQKPLPQAEDIRAKLRERYHELVAKTVAEPPAPVAGEADLRTLATELLAYIDPLDLVNFLLARDESARAIAVAGLDIPVPKPRSLAPATKARLDKPRPAAAPRAPGEPEPAPRAPRLGKDGQPKPQREQRKLSEYQEPGMTRLYVNVGKSSHLTPGKLVQLACKAGGITGESIGAIAIHLHFAFFDVKDAEADKVVTALDGISMQGKRLKANRV